MTRMPVATEKPRATVAGVLAGFLLVLLLDAAFCYAGLGRYFAYTSIFIGLWQWVWVVPLLVYARRTRRRGLKIGIHTAAWLVLALNIGAFAYVYFMFKGFPF